MAAVGDTVYRLSLVDDLNGAETTVAILAARPTTKAQVLALVRANKARLFAAGWQRPDYDGDLMAAATWRVGDDADTLVCSGLTILLRLATEVLQ